MGSFKFYHFALSIIFLAGCAAINKHNYTHDFILTEKDLDAPSSEFSNELVTQDMNVLIQFFRNGYSGYDFIEENLITESESKLLALSNSPVESWVELCGEIASIFNKLPDAHLQAFHKKNCLSKSETSGRKSEIGKNVSEGFADRAYKVVIKKSKGKTYGVVGIKRFPSFDDNKWSGFVDAVEKLKTSSVIIVDLRGNSGGDDSRGMQLAGLLKGKEIVKSEYAMDYERTNPETYILLLNKMTAKSRRSSKGAWDRYKKHYRNKLENPPAEKYTSSFETNSFQEPIAGKPYHKPIYVLVDSECGSSGESSMQALRQLKNVKVVGQNTAGVTHFGNQGLLILPNSKMRISMSTKFIKFKNGQFVEKIGHKPDIVVPNGTDALDFVISRMSHDY